MMALREGLLTVQVNVNVSDERKVLVQKEMGRNGRKKIIKKIIKKKLKINWSKKIYIIIWGKTL